MSEPVTKSELARVPLDALRDGRLVRVKHPPFDIVVGLADGEPFALEDACPHSSTSLATGCIRAGLLICPAHGWEIDLRTGAVVTAVGRGKSSPVYEARIEGDEVVVRG